MLIRILDLKYPCTFEDVGRDNPSVAIPKDISDEDLRQFGYARVEPVTAPQINPDLQSVAEGVPLLRFGKYFRTWIVTNLPAEEAEEISVCKRGQCLVIIKNAATTHLESVAQSKDYDSVVKCIGFSSSSDPVWRGDAAAMIDYQDKVWKYYYEVVNSCENVALPSLASFMSGMPVMVWPTPLI